MRRMSIVALGMLLAGLTADQSIRASAQTAAGWKTILSGSSLDGWAPIGEAKWQIVDGAVQPQGDSGFLVANGTYGDFELKVEFWASDDANSGVFIRCQDPKKPVGNNFESCYEVNIWDTRPKADHGTGAIVDVAAVVPMPKAGGKWNTYDITAKGDHMVVILNGVKTVDVHHGKHARGVIGLQHAAGVKGDTSPIKFRNVQIREL